MYNTKNINDILDELMFSFRAREQFPKRSFLHSVLYYIIAKNTWQLGWVCTHVESRLQALGCLGRVRSWVVTSMSLLNTLPFTERDPFSTSIIPDPVEISSPGFSFAARKFLTRSLQVLHLHL